MLKVVKPKFVALCLALLAGLACSGLDSQETEENAGEVAVNLPSDIQNQWEFQEAANESAVILLLTSDNRLYQEKMQFVKDPQFDLSELKSTISSISREQLPGILKSVEESKDAEKKIVYLKIDSGATFDIVAPLFRSIRESGITAVGLLTERKPDWGPGYKGLFEVLPQAPAPPNIDIEEVPNSQVLVAELEGAGNVRLNGEEQGTISDTRNLEKRLSGVLRDRTESGVFRPGSNEIEKSVYVRVSGSAKYSDLVKLIDAVMGAGARPIFISGLDDPESASAIDSDKDDLQANSNTNQ